MRMLALRLRLGEIAKVVRFHQGQWGHHNEGDETHRDHRRRAPSYRTRRSPRALEPDLRDDRVLVLPELPGFGLLLVTQQLRAGNRPGGPGLDEPGHQGPEALLPPQHAGERVG